MLYIYIMKIRNSALGSIAWTVLVSFFLLTLFASFASAQIAAAMSRIASEVICQVYSGFVAIVTGVALLIFVLSGVKWTASENDPGARKAAKDAMIHAIVGMIIVVVSYYVVQTVLANVLCPSAIP
jgi:hypothetical protein